MEYNHETKNRYSRVSTATKVTSASEVGERGENGKRQRQGARDGAFGCHGRRRACGDQGDYGLQVVQGRETALLEGRQALAHKAGGPRGLSKEERASQDTRRATGLLLAGTRQRTGYSPERGHPPPSGRRLLPGWGGPRWAIGQVLRWRGALGRGVAGRPPAKWPGSQAPEAGEEVFHERG